MSSALLAPAMFLSMATALLLGFPVALTLMAHGFIFLGIGILTGFFDPVFTGAIPLRIYAITFNELLLAIPLFTFMGMVLERSGLAEDLLETTGRLFGRISGGLGLTVIVVGALFAATTGLVQASVIAMGLISLPAMLKAGYDPRISTGVIAASATLAQVIPPSLVLIVFADVMGISIGELYAGAWLPGLVLAGLYLVMIGTTALFRPAMMPPIPPTTEGPGLGKTLAAILRSLLPPLVLLGLSLGSMFAGFATPTEAGAYGTLGAVAIATMRGRLNRTRLRQAVDSTLLLSCCAVFILVGATCFTLPFRGMDGHLWVEGLFSALPGGATGFLAVSNLIVFLLAFFLDFFEIAFIVLPLLVPVAQGLGIDLVWFAVLLCVNMQTSFMHPPFGMALFSLRSVAPPEVRSSDIYRGALPFILIQIAMVILLIAWPAMTRPFGERVRPIGPPRSIDLPPPDIPEPARIATRTRVLPAPLPAA
ncbi:MAG: TRAP transporter large permease subunit [Beijerinckiaceae bacterium]|nr:TRAP transporter large permease subunit [Beijerinckiaceae bacterium]